MTEVSELLRPGLLESVRVAIAGPARPPLVDALAALGADVGPLDADPADEQAAEAAAAALGSPAALVVDAGALFTGASDADELAPLRAAADGSWVAARSIVNAHWIGEHGDGTPGRLVFVAPAPGDGPHAEAARAALENLARTLSIEWSTHGIRTVAVTPGAGTPLEEVGALVAYLLSPAGAYFSGCRLDLD